jgi:hypothetical protein
MKRFESRLACIAALTILVAATGCRSDSDGHPDVPPPPPPEFAFCGGDFRIGDTVEWLAAIDYPYDVDEFLVDPYEVPMDVRVRVYGEAYGVDTLFEIIDPYGIVIDVVDDAIGRDPEGWYRLDVCGPWIVRVYAWEDQTGPYDLRVEAF